MSGELLSNYNKFIYCLYAAPPPMAAILSLYAIMGNRAGGRGEKTHKCKKG